MKKIQVVKDKNGKVIATYEKATAGNGPSVAPCWRPDIRSRRWMSRTTITWTLTNSMRNMASQLRRDLI